MLQKISLLVLIGFFHLVSSAPRVAVIGAGFAGETVAYRLKQKGFNVHIFEARNRVGGRVLSAHMYHPTLHEPFSIELGAHNIYDGGEARQLKALIAEMGLTIVEAHTSDAQDVYCLNDDATLISIKACLANSGLTVENLAERIETAKAQSSNMQELIDILLPGNTFATRIVTSAMASYEGSRPRLLSVECSDVLLWELQKYLLPVTSTGAEKKFVWISGGNQQLAHRLAEKLGDALHLGHVLQRVSRDAQGIYHLLFTNGARATCDILIIAIPSPTYSAIVWEASVLHPDLLRAMTSITFGENAKIIYPIDRSAGIAHIIQPTKIHRASDDFVVMHASSMLSTLTHQEIRICYLTGANSYYTSDSIDFIWSQHQPPINASGDQLIPDLASITCARDLSFQWYRGPVGHSWPCDPYARGSYSCRGVANHPAFFRRVTCAGEQVNELFAPLHDNTLFFIGEHTTDDPTILGTMEAAVESGERIAKILEALYRKETIPVEIIQLLKVTGIECKLTLSAIVEATQKAWLRPADQERWQIGDRPLGDGDKTAQFTQLPSNETEGMLLIYTTLTSLEAIRDKPIILVKAPQVEKADGPLVRPSTQHTIREWLTKHVPSAGSCLFISNQPFCTYQARVAENELPDSLSQETVGPAADDELRHRPSLLLDTIARALYQELKNKLHHSSLLSRRMRI